MPKKLIRQPLFGFVECPGASLFTKNVLSADIRHINSAHCSRSRSISEMNFFRTIVATTDGVKEFSEPIRSRRKWKW